MNELSRQEVVELLEEAGLDDFDREDLVVVVDALLETLTPNEIMSWIFFYDDELEGTPADLISSGGTRDVVKRAQRLVAGRST